MTKRSPLAPGDKVVFYNNGFRYHGEVVRLYTAGKIQVRSINGNEYDIHEKQCRRLIPKPRKEKQERVEVWGRYRRSTLGGKGSTFSHSQVYNTREAAAKAQTHGNNLIKFELIGEPVHLVELLPGETICPPGSVSVSREKLAEASEWCDKRKDQIGNKNSWFENLCEALGLGLPKEGA